jgi:transcription antitermination factor NusB
MQALYQLDVQGAAALDLLNCFLTENEQDESIRKHAFDWTMGTWEHIVQCDELIMSATIKWQFSRLSPVDKSTLRLAVYQLQWCQDIPPKVVINEAIEIAKKYSTDKSPAFVNGVLDSVLKTLNITTTDQGR